MALFIKDACIHVVRGIEDELHLPGPVVMKGDG